MELQFWGVRGTFPAARRPGSKIGGNTPCTEVASSAGDIIVIDAGTGIRALGDDLISNRSAKPLGLSVLFTHFHIDHVQGLPFFAPLLLVDADITFYSAIDPEDVKGHLARLMGKPYFPMPFDKTPAAKSFRRIDENGVRIGPVRVTACPLHHPQGAVAYRLEEDGTAVVIATDTEPDGGPLDERLVKFAEGASCLVSDATFTPEEYAAGKKGWGHSTWRDGATLAGAANVARHFLSHFNPDHSDRTILGLERQARRVFPRTVCAREGMRLALAPPAPALKEFR